MQIYPCVGGSGDGRTDDVDNTKHRCSPLFGFLYCCESIDSLSGLAYRYNDGAILDDWVAISEFTGVLGFRRDTCQLFKQKFTDQTGVERCSAGDQDEPFSACQLAQIRIYTAKFNPVIAAVDSTAHTGAQCLGLLEDLFEHVVREIA